MIVIAVDPGESGAVVLYDDEVHSLDVRRDFKGLPAIAKAIVELSGIAPVDFGVVELVGARPGQGVTSMFSFGRSTGVALGAMYARNLGVIEIAPGTWQNYWRRNCDAQPGNMPFMSTLVAETVFPEYARFFARKKDHGTADAALLAAYATITLREKLRLPSSRLKNLSKVSLSEIAFKDGRIELLRPHR